MENSKTKIKRKEGEEEPREISKRTSNRNEIFRSLLFCRF